MVNVYKTIILVLLIRKKKVKFESLMKKKDLGGNTKEISNRHNVDIWNAMWISEMQCGYLKRKQRNVVRFTLVVSWEKEIEKLSHLRVEETHWVRGIGEERALDEELSVLIQPRDQTSHGWWWWQL